MAYKTDRLHLYRETLRIKVGSFACPDCGTVLLPKVFEKHCSQEHHFNPKLGCVWCKDYFWRSGTKYNHADHLLKCFRQFHLIHHIPNIPTTATNLRLLDVTHSFPENDSFGIHHDLPSCAHEIPWPPNVESYPKYYADENLQLAVSYLQLYLEKQNTCDWLQVMVKSVAFESFVRAMEEDGGTSQTLLFSCWCDGGPYEEARHRQHKHMIICSPKNHFQNHVWPKVKANDRPCANFPSKRYKHFVSPRHLANTIGYLSHRKSRCQFSSKDSNAPLKDNHFFLNKTLPIHFLLPLVLTWDNGIEELLFQEKFQNASVERIVDNPLTFVDHKWKQQIKDFYGHEKGLVMPVLKELTPTSDVDATHVFHLMNGRKLHFAVRPENRLLHDDAWLAMQAAGGNSFYDAVEDEYWTPRPKHQIQLNNMKPLMERIKELEAENAELKRKCEEVSCKGNSLKRRKSV